MSDIYSATRRSLHAIAEQVLAGPQHRATGEIALRVTTDGFETTAGTELRLTSTHLICAAGQFELAGATCAGLAADAGVDVGPPRDLYADVTGVDPHQVLELDPIAAEVLLDSFVRGDAALRALAPEQSPILWPEHFDVGITFDEVNYGVSPGDGFLDEPYAYVGPWQPRSGEFWNAPFGAAHRMHELPGDRLVEFLRRGRELAADSAG